MRKDSESISQGVAAKLIRELRTRNYGATPVNTGRQADNWDIEKIWVTKNGKNLCDINCETGTISYKNSYDREEINSILQLIQNLKDQEDVYTNSPSMKTEGLERYKLLAEYNNAVLAACEITTLDSSQHKVNRFEFVTWEKDKVRDGVHTGRYFDDDYIAAKENFSIRAGLVNKNKLFSETEMLTIYSGLVKLQDIDEITTDQEKIINKIKDKIREFVPDVENKIYYTNPKCDESKEFIDNYEVTEDDEQEI